MECVCDKCGYVFDNLEIEKFKGTLLTDTGCIKCKKMQIGNKKYTVEDICSLILKVENRLNIRKS